MRVPLAALILALSLQAVTAAAAAAPDRCDAREEALRTEAENACSGLSYLFNPSGCFIARKAMQAFDDDKCRADAAPAQTVTAPPRTTTEAVPPQASEAAVPPPRSDTQEKAQHGAAVPEPNVAQLKEEIARLKAEIVRLRAEMEQLKAGKGADGGTR
jgi:uncharacterized small protein (DUF1192 family)